MKALRWIAAFPIACAVSVAAWIALSSILRSSSGGYSVLTFVTGRAPIVIRTFFPTALFILSAVSVCPSKGRASPFVFLALSLPFSGAGMELVEFYQLGIPTFWVTAYFGMISGALVGFLVSVQIQTRRRNRPNRVAGSINSPSPHTTARTGSTSAAGSGATQP